MALAVVLDVSPVALLLPYTRGPHDRVEITGWRPTDALTVWGFATASGQLEWEGSVEDMQADFLAFRGRSLPWWVEVETRERRLEPRSMQLWNRAFEESGKETNDEVEERERLHELHEIDQRLAKLRATREAVLEENDDGER